MISLVAEFGVWCFPKTFRTHQRAGTSTYVVIDETIPPIYVKLRHKVFSRLGIVDSIRHRKAERAEIPLQHFFVLGICYNYAIMPGFVDPTWASVKTLKDSLSRLLYP